MARLNANVYVDGAWYGPSYPTAAVTPEVIAAVDPSLVVGDVGSAPAPAPEPPAPSDPPAPASEPAPAPPGPGSGKPANKAKSASGDDKR